jgi:hypothetical protein
MGVLSSWEDKEELIARLFLSGLPQENGLQ